VDDIELSNLISILIISQTSLIPILGLIWLGIRRERLERDRQIRELMKTLQVISISRGRHLR
jgi:hypothetical protein